jgi:hypothetical protein
MSAPASSSGGLRLPDKGDGAAKAEKTEAQEVAHEIAQGNTGGRLLSAPAALKKN